MRGSLRHEGDISAVNSTSAADWSSFSFFSSFSGISCRERVGQGWWRPGIADRILQRFSPSELPLVGMLPGRWGLAFPNTTATLHTH